MLEFLNRGLHSLGSPRLGRCILCLLMLFATTLPSPSHAAVFLEPEKAFRFSASMPNATTIEVKFRIADGYYMYHERFAFKADGANLGDALVPSGKVKFDETFQKDVESHRGPLTISIPVEASGAFLLSVTSQGCSDEGLCYAPMESTVQLTPGGGGFMAALGGGVGAGALISSATTDALNAPNTALGRVEASLQSGSLLLIIPLFMLLGLGLSLTPCVLPMVPILSSIIVGEGVRVSRQRGFVLSVTYSLGMALVYTGLGVAAGLAGEGLAATLQTPWVLASFALLMVGLSLSMFGVYQLQVPVAIQARLMRASDHQSSGKLPGVFAMGAISALIVGPCVAAPLAGVLLYISQTRDAAIGASALFAMAVGMSVPLLLVGLSAGSLLPRAGQWMGALKTFFGVLMLALAVWTVAPVVPAWATMAGWALLGIGYGIYLLFGRWGWVSKTVAVFFLVLGTVQLIGLASGGRDALEPLAHLTGDVHKTEFRRVHSVAELDQVLLETDGRIVMLDFYADWCVSCIEMEKLTFSDSRVRGELETMILLQADVTANNEDDKELLRRFKLFGPPGIIFFNGQGQEIPGGRVIGFQDASKFLRSLQLVKSF